MRSVVPGANLRSGMLWRSLYLIIRPHSDYKKSAHENSQVNFALLENDKRKLALGHYAIL